MGVIGGVDEYILISLGKFASFLSCKSRRGDDLWNFDLSLRISPPSSHQTFTPIQDSDQSSGKPPQALL
jgi:hypothetical protein